MFDIIQHIMKLIHNHMSKYSSTYLTAQDI